MPEQVSPTGDDWGAAVPARGAPPSEPGSPARPSRPPSGPGGTNVGWDTPDRDTPDRDTPDRDTPDRDTPAWGAPTRQGAGPAADGWSAAPGQPAASFDVGRGAAGFGGTGHGGAGFGGTGFGGAPPDVLPAGSPGTGSSIKPPIGILLVGLVLPLASIGLLFLDGPAAHVVGWLIAIVGSIGALAVFTAVDLRRRSSSWYVDRPGLLAGLRIAVLLTGLVVATCFAYLIADAVARWEVWF